MYMNQGDKTFCSIIHVMTSIVQVITVSCYKKDFFLNCLPVVILTDTYIISFHIKISGGLYYILNIVRV